MVAWQSTSRGSQLALTANLYRKLHLKDSAPRGSNAVPCAPRFARLFYGFGDCRLPVRRLSSKHCANSTRRGACAWTDPAAHIFERVVLTRRRRHASAELHSQLALAAT